MWFWPNRKKKRVGESYIAFPSLHSSRKIAGWIPTAHQNTAVGAEHVSLSGEALSVGGKVSGTFGNRPLDGSPGPLGKPTTPNG